MAPTPPHQSQVSHSPSKNALSNKTQGSNLTPQGPDAYYIPEPSHWPIIGSIGLCTTVVGIAHWIHKDAYGPYVFLVGTLILIYMMFGWFSTVIHESEKNYYNNQVDRTYRWGMVWFIFSEVMFFAAFFGTLFYVREWSIPWMAGEGSKPSTHMLWENFKNVWPLLQNPDPSKYPGPKEVISAWGIPAINTLILLSSGVTVTWAHHALKDNHRKSTIIGLACTVLLGALFISLQAYEYHHAYTELGLTLSSGIFGTTFFMLTGFHGAHVTIGAIMLTVILIRCIKGSFTPERHFAFEAAAWYWHFVDVVWLMLFILVYWL